MANASLPKTMKAWQYSSTTGGFARNLHINSSAPLPIPAKDQHLVKIIAVALNPVDYKPQENPIIHRLAVPKPATPGIDFAGTIVTPASGSALKPGQLVFGCCGRSPLAGGALAEYGLSTNESAVALPDAITPIDGASVGVAGLTAYQSIVPKVQKGQNVFINGGSGGTGVFGIQIAKAIGCHVTTTCSTRNVELCKSLGADEVIDYTKQDIVEAAISNKRKYDLIIDNVFNTNLYWKSEAYTNPGATFVIIAGTPSLSFAWNSLKMKIWPAFLGGSRTKAEGFLASAKLKDLNQIRTWMEEKKVKAVIDSKFSFDQAPEAFEKLKTGRARGKIVVEVSPAP